MNSSSSKKLKNMAYGIAESFISRNNDIDGYWALGVIKGELNENDND